MNHLEDYLLTLDICRGALPPEHCHRHYQWLRKIERIVRRAFANNGRLHMMQGQLVEAWYAREDRLPTCAISRPMPASQIDPESHQRRHEIACGIRHALVDRDKRRLLEGQIFEPWYALEAYLPTFAICHAALSGTASYVHQQRLLEIEHFFRRALAGDNRRRLAKVEAWYTNDALGG
jgi:hypothetical protein